MKLLVTGCAGFIGSHLCEKLLDLNYDVVGIDIINDYYNQAQKYKNLGKIFQHKNSKNFSFLHDNLIDTQIIANEDFDVVVNIGAMAGVRYSLDNPDIYIDTNIKGQVNLLQQCVNKKVKLFVYASSSSVYGNNNKIPFSETDELANINSVYAMTKKCSEDFADLYHRLYGINVVGLRFFTVYGPRGRPDMFIYKILNSIINKKQFVKFGDGTSYRDYTYIDDIVDGIILSIECNLEKIKNNSKINEIYNLGNSHPITLNEIIKLCESITGEKVSYIEESNQTGDVEYTFADITKAKLHLGYEPKTNLNIGLKKMYEWMCNENVKRDFS